MFSFQESALVGSVVRRLLLNYITRPRIPSNGAAFPIFAEESQPGVLQKVGSAAGKALPFLCSLSLSHTRTNLSHTHTHRNTHTKIL